MGQEYKITKSPSRIGSLRENSLHSSIKYWYSQEGDFIEHPVKGYIIDIVRNNLLIEVQTGNFHLIKKKLDNLLEEYNVRLVYPISINKWIVKEDPNSGIHRRLSPRHGKIEDIFTELVRISHYPKHNNFSLEVLFIQEEEVQVPNDLESQRVSWRRKGWMISDRRLISVENRLMFNSVDDYMSFLHPVELLETFTIREFGVKRRIPYYLSAKMVYCLHNLGFFTQVGKRKRANLYQRTV